MRHRNPRGDKEVRGTQLNIKIVATRCHILRLKCTKFDFGWGSAPRPRWGSSQRSPNLLAGFKGVLLLREGKGIGGKGREWRRGGREKEGSKRIA